MKLLFICVFIVVTMTACGSRGDVATNANSATPGVPKAEKAALSVEQQELLKGGTEASWPEQGLAWSLPGEWTKILVNDETLYYQSSYGAFLSVKVTRLPDDIAPETNTLSFYDQAKQQLDAGRYQSVKMLDIVGLQGVEFVEAPPEDSKGPRRHQWIAYRKYQGVNQQLNVMTAIESAMFDQHANEMAAALYSMKLTK